MSEQKSERVADADKQNWVDLYAPEIVRPWMRLARLDRPIGFWLLFWPGAISLALAAVAHPEARFSFHYLALFWLGAVVMRGAGCTLNDIVDRNIDARVERTRARPLPAGQVSVGQAIIFLLAQCLVGLVILLQFNDFTRILGIVSLVPAASYPFMKRFVHWPQLFLGVAFGWGALMGWAALFGTLHAPAYWLYAGCILWIIAYDTIYALQDREDDALIGVKSTARLFGTHVREIAALFYVAALACWWAAARSAGAETIFPIVYGIVPLLLTWQIVTLKPDDGRNCLIRFRSSHLVGMSLALALLAEAGYQLWFLA